MSSLIFRSISSVEDRRFVCERSGDTSAISAYDTASSGRDGALATCRRRESVSPAARWRTVSIMEPRVRSRVLARTGSSLASTSSLRLVPRRRTWIPCWLNRASWVGKRSVCSDALPLDARRSTPLGDSDEVGLRGVLVLGDSR